MYDYDHLLCGLGADAGGGDAGEEVKKCLKSVNTSSWDSKEDREQQTKAVGSCTADALCAIYSKGAIPPGVCSSVAGPVIDKGIELWNDLFGDDSEAEAARQRRIDAANYWKAATNAAYLDGMMSAELLAAATRLAEFNDAVRPWAAGAYGGGIKIDYGFSNLSDPSESFQFSTLGSDDATPAIKLMYKAGLGAVGPCPNSSDCKPYNPGTQALTPHCSTSRGVRPTAWCVDLGLPERTLFEHGMFLQNTEGVNAASAWLKLHSQQLTVAFINQTKAAEYAARAMILGEKTADQRTGRDTIPSKTVTGTVVKAGALVGAGALVWHFRTPIWHFVSRILKV